MQRGERCRGFCDLNILPPEFVKIDKLCYLNLRNNRLQHLPIGLEFDYMGQFCTEDYGDHGGSYSALVLDSNPLISPPREIVEQGTLAILGYLRDQADQP